MRPPRPRGLYGERQALEARLVDEPSIIVAAVISGGGVAALRALLAVARPRATRRSPVALRHVRRLPRAAGRGRQSSSSVIESASPLEVFAHGSPSSGVSS